MKRDRQRIKSHLRSYQDTGRWHIVADYLHDFALVAWEIADLQFEAIANARLAFEFQRGARTLQPAIGEYADGVAKHLGLLHVVGGDQNGLLLAKIQ